MSGTFYAFRVVCVFCCKTFSVWLFTIQRLLLQPYLLGPHEVVSINNAAPNPSNIFLFINQIFILLGKDNTKLAKS